MVRVKLDAELRNSIIDVLINDVPIAEKSEGRDTLLLGIPNAASWTRVRNNDHADLATIINYLINTFLEDDTSQQWGLLIFLDTAYRTVQYSSAGKTLQELQKKCLECLNRVKPQSFVSPSSGIPASDTFVIQKQMTPFLHPPPQSIQKPFPEPLPIEEHHSEMTSTEESFLVFFETTALYVQAALGSLNIASKPFNQNYLGGAEQSQCRTALRHLGSTIQQIHQLCDFLEHASPLPEMIVTKRHLFTDHAYYLMEQVQELAAWINESSGSHPGIANKITTIRREFTYFDSLQGGR